MRTAAAASKLLVLAHPNGADRSEARQKRNQPARTNRHFTLASGGVGLGRSFPACRQTVGSAHRGSLWGPDVGTPASAGRVAGATLAP